jgi:acetyl-CoA C-acetyltransferase
MPEAFLVGGTRTPVGRYGGALASVRPDDLAALVVAEALRRAGVQDAVNSGDAVLDEVILGAANQAGEDNRNVARMAVLLAGLPDSVPGVTVNRLCASGMTAITIAAQAIRAGDADLIVAGGVESMTRAPWVQAKPEKAWGKPGAAFDTSIGWRFPNPRLIAREKATFSMPETGEEVARVDNISREDADRFAYDSQMRAAAAIDAGHFADEIVVVPTAKGEVTVDETPRRETTLEVLATLKPVVAGGSVVTAGNSSPLNDGAAALLIGDAAGAAAAGRTPLARIAGRGAHALEPQRFGFAPVEAADNALARAGVTWADVAAVELNEAFAVQSLACVDAWGIDPAIVNATGGAIAIGHPLGASGGRILGSLAHRLRDSGDRWGVAAICIGVGQALAVVLENVA